MDTVQSIYLSENYNSKPASVISISIIYLVGDYNIYQWNAIIIRSHQ